MLRLWIASSDRYEMSAGKQAFKGATDSYRRIRNTIRFLLANTDDFNPSTDSVDIADMVSLDKFIMYRASLVQTDIAPLTMRWTFISCSAHHGFLLARFGRILSRHH